MNEKLLVRTPIYPVIGIAATLLILAIGLVTAKSATCILFLGGMWGLFLLFGYWRACLAILPVAAVLGGVLAGLTFAISRDPQATYAAVNRILALCIAVIPGLSLSPIYLVRNLSTLKMPRMVTLGMLITLTFFPLLRGEVRQVREAMKTRGAGSLLSPQIFYRAFLIPLIIRLVNISDTLALSVETRGFTKEATDHTVYKTVQVRPADIFFLLCTVTGAVLAVVL